MIDREKARASARQIIGSGCIDGGYQRRSGWKITDENIAIGLGYLILLQCETVGLLEDIRACQNSLIADERILTDLLRSMQATNAAEVKAEDKV